MSSMTLDDLRVASLIGDKSNPGDVMITPGPGGSVGIRGNLHVTGSVSTGVSDHSHIFQVRRIRNGYILAHARAFGQPAYEDYCEDMKSAGERVTAILVEMQLKETI